MLLTLKDALDQITPADQTAMDEAKARWDAVAKPLHSLGLLEDAITRVAGMTGTPEVDFHRRAVVVMCADNGVVDEGVAQTGREVTALVAENMSRGDASVCRMAAVAGVEVVPVDIGVAVPVSGARVLRRAVRRGTGNIAKGPAMTREEAAAAVCTGIDLVRELKAQGYRLLATGEMGIGNTTTSSALVSALLRLPPARVTGRGAGLSTPGLARKIQAIETALSVNHPDPNDPLDVLSKVGGLDLAGLAGIFLGGAACRVPVLIDGFISSAAALAASKLHPACVDYMLASHASNEPAGRLVLDALGLKPFLYAGMCLGEGTGAVAAIPLLDMALAVYSGMPTFDEIALEAYQPLD